VVGTAHVAEAVQYRRLDRRESDCCAAAMNDSACPHRAARSSTPEQRQMTLKDKLKALDQALRDVEKQFGGYPRGRVVEVYGPEASGKTTLTLHAIAEVPARGRTWRPSSTPSTRSTPTTRRALGVDVSKLW
jgi:polynucleotide 5'-kinase involved in rRNA processing